MTTEPTIDDYLLWLNDDSPEIRRNAAWWLGRQRDFRIVEPLAQAADDPDANVRLRVAESLGSFKDERVVAPLARLLQHDSDTEVRAAAATSLGSALDVRGVEPLLAALKDSQAPVRAAAAAALGMLHDSRAVPALVDALLHDLENDVLFQAAKSLAELGGTQTVDLLLAALDAAEPGVKMYIIETLGLLHDKRAIEPLKAYLDAPDIGLRETAKWALSKLGSR